MAPRERRERQWYKLDNAGVLYSAIQKENYSAIYRFSAVMEERMDPSGPSAGGGQDHAPLSRLCGTHQKRGLLVLF